MLLKSILSIVLLALPVSAQDSLTYRVNYSTNKPNIIHIAIQPSQPLRGPLTLIIPRAITSGYSQEFYDRYVESTSAASPDGRPLNIGRQEGSRWRIGDRDALVSVVEYDVNLARLEQEITGASDASKRRPEYVGLLGYSVFGFLEGKENTSIQLEVRGPDGWPIFTTLAPKSPADKSSAKGAAKDFYALADSQIAMGPRLNVRQLEAPVPLFFISCKQGPKVGPKTLRNLHKALEPMFESAIRWKLLSENPCTHVELPAWDRAEARYLDPDQARNLLAAARSDKWYVAFLLSLELGTRPNETLGIRWSDVDWERTTIRIRRSLYWPKGGGFEFTKPKTERSVRTITISALAIEELRRHRVLQLEQRMEQGADYQDYGLIFATEIGTPLLWRNLGRRHLKPVLKAADIRFEGFSLYSLRHTHAALRIANGDNVFVIARDMGTSVSMIDSTYGHVPRPVSQASSDKLAQLLYGT